MKSPIYISHPDIPLNGWVQFKLFEARINPAHYRLCLVYSTGQLYVLLHYGSDTSWDSRRSVFNISEVCQWNTFEELIQTPGVLLQRTTDPLFLGEALSFNTFDALKHEVQNLILEHSL